MRTKLSLRAIAAGLLLVGLLLLLSSVATRAAQFGRAGHFDAEAFKSGFEFGDKFDEFAAGFGKIDAKDFTESFEGRAFGSVEFTKI